MINKFAPGRHGTPQSANQRVRSVSTIDYSAVPIADLLNLCEESAALLRRASIQTGDDLKKPGAIQAYLRVKEIDSRASLNLLWALAAALLDPPRRWQEVARHDRLSLHLQLEVAEKR